MVDFLTRLAGRALGLEPPVEPTRVHRYAEDRRADGPWPDIEQAERSAGASLQPMSSAEDSRRSAPVSEATSDAPTAGSPGPSPSRDDDPTGGAVRNSPWFVPQGVGDLPEPLAPEARMVEESGRRSRSEKRPDDDGLLMPEERRRGNEAAGEDQPVPADRPEPAPPASLEQHRSAPERPRQVEPAVDRDRGPAEPSAGVRVSIGTIEIRAVHEPPSSPPRRSRRVQPRLALTDYLEQRDRGDR